jgi:hypothetical protein
MDHTDEMKYRTDGENPNNIILDIIERQGLCRWSCLVLKRRIEGYIEEDF